jgi:hypothetical protein
LKLLDFESFISGDEYALFTKLEMWNQGNDAKELWATAFIAYDCENKILVSGCLYYSQEISKHIIMHSSFLTDRSVLQRT